MTRVWLRIIADGNTLTESMSIPSPVKESLQRDPFELDRLAEELVTREQASSSPQPITSDYHLPLHVPLSHENKYLAADEFNVEEFLLSRSYTSLPDLRSELRDYLANLKEELVQLINDDYEAFISLSTDLRGEGTRLERLGYPLGYLKSQILVSLFL
jgi:conserved oligomeric Golgi complex subunit 2